MNQVYTLVANIDKQKQDAIDELSLIANCYPSDNDLNTLLRTRETTLYNRLSTLDSTRAGYIDDFVTESPALTIPSSHETDVKSCAVKYIDALKLYSSQDLEPLWAHLDNCSTSTEKQCAIWSFCDL
jgi:hypothetical protein